MILFVAYGGGHVAALAPVALALRARGVPFVFLALTTARAYLERLGIAAIGMADLPGAAEPEVLAHGERLAATLPPGGTVAHHETVAYLGLNYRDLCAAHGPQQAAERYAREGRQAFLPVPTMAAAIAALRPQLVVATNAPRAEQAAILAAGQAGVPALCLVDLFAAHEIKWCGQPGYGTRVCVLNEAVRDAFVAYGRAPEQVLVTGNPAFDRLRDPAAIAAGARLRQARGWDDGCRTVLWASQIESARHPFTGQEGDPTLPRRIEQELRRLVAADPGLRLVVRYHPSEREVFVAQDRVALSTAEDDLSSLLHAVDVVVVTASTVGLEAALAGRPVVSVDDSIYHADAPYSAMGIASGAPTVAALVPVLQAVLARPAPAAGAAAPGDSATARVTAAILDLLPKQS